MIRPEDIEDMAMGYDDNGKPLLIIRMKPEVQWLDVWVNQADQDTEDSQTDT